MMYLKCKKCGFRGHISEWNKLGSLKDGKIFFSCPKCENMETIYYKRLVGE